MFSYIWNALVIVWSFSPIWLPIVLAILAWELFQDYIQDKFAASKKKILLEILLPQDITKSPLAMELALGVFYNPSREATFFDKKFKGSSRPRFSLELVSIGGKIHFYIWTEDGYRSGIESQLYSQFPQIEIREVPDYAQGVVYQPGVNDMFGVEWVKTKPNPIPLKTYVDFGMDKDPKDEYKIDPMTPTIEFMGSIKEGEQVWMQIVFRAHKSEIKKAGSRKRVDWSDEATTEKNRILDSLKNKDNPLAPARRPTKGEEETIAAIERSIGKTAFDVGIRCIYFASSVAGFNRSSIGGIMGTTKQYSSNSLNGLKPQNSTTIEYPWGDYKGIRLNTKKITLLNYYKQRRYFGLHKRKSVVLNDQELATMFHFPGIVSTTPSFSRIMSKKAEAPANLPI